MISLVDLYKQGIKKRKELFAPEFGGLNNICVFAFGICNNALDNKTFDRYCVNNGESSNGKGSNGGICPLFEDYNWKVLEKVFSDNPLLQWELNNRDK